MVPNPSQVFASKVAALAASYAPRVSGLTPKEDPGPDGKTYYYVLAQLQGRDRPYRTELSHSPLTAYRYARRFILTKLSTPKKS